MKCSFTIFDYPGKVRPELSIGLPEGLIMVSSTILDVWSPKEFLKFVDDIISGVNKQNKFGGEGYQAGVVEKDGKKMLEFNFYLTDDYEPNYLEPEKFKKILEVYIGEKEKFDQDTEAYKKELEKLGGEKVVWIEI